MPAVCAAAGIAWAVKRRLPTAGTVPNNKAPGSCSGQADAVRPDVQPVDRSEQPGAGRGQIGLGDEDTIGNGDLACGLGVTGQGSLADDRVDQRDDCAKSQHMAEHRVGGKRVEDGRRIGQAAGLDDDAAEAPHLPGVPALDEAAHRRDDVQPAEAAEAAARHLQHLLVHSFDQKMVEPHLSGFVDDDGGIRHVRRCQNALQQARLAAAKEARQDGDGRLSVRHPATGSGGTFRWKSVAAWNALPTLRQSASSKGLPTIWMATGRPLAPKPDGSMSAGMPV